MVLVMITRLILLYAIIAQIADAYLTVQGVNVCGLQCEGNPLAYKLMELYGPVHGMLALKGIVLPMAIYAWNGAYSRYGAIIAVALALSGTIGFVSWLI